jgi:DNA-binding NtrC family response regulator
VLIAAEDGALRQVLGQQLRQDGCLVLEAESAASALRSVVSHSRSIHVLLADINTIEPDSMIMFRRYRPGIQILFVTRERNGAYPGPVGTDQALEKVRELLNLSKRGMTITAA